MKKEREFHSRVFYPMKSAPLVIGRVPNGYGCAILWQYYVTPNEDDWEWKMNDTTKWMPPDPLTTDWWEQACECYAAGKPNPPITEVPQTSWLRASLTKDGPLLPVCYWYTDGNLYCLVDDRSYGRPFELWPFASKRPVTTEQWEYYEIHGKWPDMPDTVYIDNEMRGLARLKANIEPLLAQAAEMIKGGAAKTQDDAVKANNLHNQLTSWYKLHITASGKDELRKIRSEDPEITPEVIKGFDTYQRISTQCVDLVKRCEIYKTLKAICIDPYLKANKPNVPAGEQRMAKTLPGVVGRTVSLTKIKKVKLVDFDAALAHMRTLNAENAELRAFVQELGQKLYRRTKGGVAPGFEEYEEEESR